MAKESKSIQEALNTYDKSDDRSHIEAGEKERQEILSRFPLEGWPELPLERYALGQDDTSDTFCWWLEFGSPHLGSMRGGSAAKHLIYKHKNKPGWYYYQTFKDEQEAWNEIRGSFVQAFELAKTGQWESIDELKHLLGGRSLRVKALHVYFPSEIISVTSVYHMQHFLKRMGGWKAEMANWEAVHLNRALLQALRAVPQLKDWKTNELERFLYYWADPRQSRRIFKIAPGEDAKYWPECRENGYICVGWDEVGDLREFENKQAYKAFYAEKYSERYKDNPPTVSKKANELWTLMELEPGDVIVANQGTAKILALGEVVEPGYQWRPGREQFKHTVAVKWDESYAQEIPPQQRWVFSTVDPVSASLYQKILAQKNGPQNGGKPVSIDPLFVSIADALERKGQVVLYGPPGTGKTYYARRFGVWWLTRQEDLEQAQELLLEPEALQAAERKLGTSPVAKRVWWMVANPKVWSWETLFKEKRVEFDYGRLQRNYPLVRPGDLVVGYQSRPDKRIMALGQVTKGISESENDKPTIEIKPLRIVTDGPTYEELLNDSVLQYSEPIRNRCQGTLFALNGDEAQYLLDLLAEKDSEINKNDTSGEGVGYLTWITFHPSYSYEDFIEGFRPVDKGGSGLALRLEDGVFKRICREAQVHPNQRYLVLIDEINRANLAKVFGELITLLESDKRGILVTLPQSKDSFTIPSNVFLLGTMNTADRSIKLLDAALRRRFAFIEMMPDLTLLSGAMVNGLALDDFLEGLNRRIAETEGREKQIGHAFLLENDQPLTEPGEFARRFRQEILPLLQEYCYDDYATLANYLGDQLVDKKSQMLNFDILNDDEGLIEALAQWLTAGKG